MTTLTVGLVPLDPRGTWMGGRYYLQHLVKAVSFLPSEERPRLIDLYWTRLADDDPFSEVRPQLSDRRVLTFPTSPVARIARKARRFLTHADGAADLFAGIDVVFPIPLIENQGIPLAYWLPDLQYLHFPEFYPPDLLKAMREADRSRIHQASRIVVSSEFGRKDAERAFPETRGRIDVLRFCSVPDLLWSEADPVDTCRELSLPDSFFIVSNQFTEHKNHLVILAAMARLRERGVTVHVVCTGSAYDFRGRDYFGKVKEFVEHHHLHDRVHFTGLLPRQSQIAVLRRAIAVLQPSRFEGWSTVIEDGKALGKPILATGIPVHREQLGERHPWLLDPDDENGWAAAMEACATVPPGPDAAAEGRGLDYVRRAALACARVFTSAMHRAARDPRPD